MSGVPPVGNRVNGSKMVHLSLRGRSGSNYHLGRKLEERDGNQYLATEINSQRRVVINILALPNRFDVHEAGRMRNTLEAQYRFMSKIDSPHLLKALDRGVTPEGRPFIVMEYAEGKSLEEFPRGILKAKDGPGIMLQITEGLKNLSEIGLSHGGLTPANILLEEGKVVFLDPVLPVGEASDALTDTQQIAGTKNYMAPFSYYSRAKSPPPQAPARIRIDIYSLGIIFYEFLAGQNPFRVMGQSEHMSYLCGREKFIPAWKDVPHRLFRVISKMLSPLPENNYHDYDSLIADLNEALGKG